MEVDQVIVLQVLNVQSSASLLMPQNFMLSGEQAGRWLCLILHGGFVKPSFEMVNGAADGFKLLVITGGDGRVAFLFERFDAGFDFGLVDADRSMMLVQIDMKRAADSDEQMFFVHLGVALHCVVFDAFGYVAKLGYGLLFEFFISVSHKKCLLRKVWSRESGVGNQKSKAGRKELTTDH
jgi:hypothetical protein